MTSVWRRFRRNASKLVYGIYDKRLIQQAAGRHPRHVGVVLDGNRRWALEAGFDDVVDGHRAGANRIKDLLSWCQEAEVQLVTLWLLSTDNVTRPQEELGPLLKIIEDVVDELAEDHKTWRVRIIGALDVLPDETATRIVAAARRTEGRSGMEVNIAVGYGGRREIADAVRKLLQQHAEEGTPSRSWSRSSTSTTSPSTCTPRVSPIRTSSSGPPVNSGCPASCCGSPRIPSSGSARPTGPTSAAPTSSGPCATTRFGTAGSVPEERGRHPARAAPSPRKRLERRSIRRADGRFGGHPR